MVITRAQSASNNPASNANMNYYSDNEGDTSLPRFAKPKC